MSKPSTFQAEYIVVKRTQYLKTTTSTRNEGPLDIGRVVWLDRPVAADVQDHVTAYVEPVGLVQLDPHCLQSL